MNNQRSTFNLSARKLGNIALSSATSVLVLGFTLWILHQPYAATPEFYEHRLELFWKFGALFAVVVPISTISLVGGVRTDVRLFSKLGRFALAWPLIPFLILLLAPIVTPIIWGLTLIGVALGAIAFIRSTVTKRDWRDCIAIPLNMAWLWISYAYGQEWWLVYGD
jgi:hypothetical protein